uniref:Galectin n=1 Tax=Rhodnius prolixus TaxID=13249 RepID=T1I3Y1_RHOPR
MFPVLKGDNTEFDLACEAIEYSFPTDSEAYYISDSGFGIIVPIFFFRFSLDLSTHIYDKFNNKKTEEIVFHFNPRFEQNCVVRNSYFNGEWGQEEVHATKKNPFKRGQMFIMEIYVMKSEYLVSVNGVHFCSFVHRIQPSSVDSIHINGDVQLLKLELSKREMYPSTERTLLLVDDPHNKMISVNGVHFCSYQHRFPPSAVESFEVRGDVALKRIDLCRKDTYPTKKETLYPDLNQLE